MWMRIRIVRLHSRHDRGQRRSPSFVRNTTSRRELGQVLDRSSTFDRRQLSPSQCREADSTFAGYYLTSAKQLGADDLGSALVERPQRLFAGLSRQCDVQAVSEVYRTLSVQL